MDKRNKRNEASDKKIDNKVKGMGDLKKANDRNVTNDKIKKICENTRVDKTLSHPESGDAQRKKSTNQKPEKMRTNIKQSTNEDKLKKVGDGAIEKEVATKKNNDKDEQEKGQCEVELRKRIRDKYTLKLKSFVTKNDLKNSNSTKKKDEGNKLAAVKSDGSKNDDRPKKQMAEEKTQHTTTTADVSTASSGKTDFNLDKKREKTLAKPETNPVRHERMPTRTEKHPARRKPIIKTIMSKNGPIRIYKAVTFVDQRNDPTPLEIKIPVDALKKQKLSKFTDTTSLRLRSKTTDSRVSIKSRKPQQQKRRYMTRRREKKSKHINSPAASFVQPVNKSPPTEVARWVPSCIDRHTKPYYEAWVNTTLAAISKGTKKDRLFLEKHRDDILASFKRALQERPQSPELFYENFADEKYTGRIKITQR